MAVQSSLFPCSVTIGGTPPIGEIPGVLGRTYYFKSSSVYSTLADQTGVTVLDKTWAHDEPLVSIAELERSGKVVRVKAAYTTDLAHNNRTKYIELVINRNKYAAISTKDSLKNKPLSIVNYKTGDSTIVGYFLSAAYTSRRAINRPY